MTLFDFTSRNDVAMWLYQVFKALHVNINEHTSYAIMTQSKVQVIVAGVKLNWITKKKKIRDKIVIHGLVIWLI